MTQEEDTQEFLAHYGVLGMKWGKTRATAGSRDIRLARANVVKAKRANDKKVDKLYTAAKKGRTAVNQTDVKRIKAEFLNNPDRVTAARMTRGEKAVAGIIATLATGGYGGGLVAAGGSTGVTSARSRTIERRQETGYYNK